VTLLTRGVVGGLRQVAAVLVAVAVQLAFDRGRAAAQLVGDGAHRATQPQQISDLQSALVLVNTLWVPNWSSTAMTCGIAGRLL
jgi:hypothetical protein